ncbi:MAG: type II toxin-antitoxin system HicB family antitoxin [Tannerella sp.]|jgi:predicted HicB family RNase H-like nuclease|nr:type II toxin-antitoxin system HicB family antitoxin [Tannerella sp.]
MDKLEYKGYFGSIEYSKEDECLFGKVTGMPDNLISYEGNTAAELYADFKEAIDSYLDYCKEKGIKPRKSYNGMLNIRIPSEIHRRIAIIADRTVTSINAFIRDSRERKLESMR